MKKKKLNRDGWGLQNFPYYQIRIDCDVFHGMVCIIKLTDGEPQYWQTPRAGRIMVAGAGMTWLQMIPDNTNRVITVPYFPDGVTDAERTNYPKTSSELYKPSIWYVDVIEGTEIDENGVIVFIDKYLDVIFTPEGDVKVDDLDELDAALDINDIDKEQYQSAMDEGELILRELCADIAKTERITTRVRCIAEDKIKEGEKPLFLFHGSRYDLDIIKPMQASGQCECESLNGIYAAAGAKEVVPFALPIRRYPDSSDGKRSFECEGGMTRLLYGSLDPAGKGYIYKLKSDSFSKIDDWQWVSDTPCEIVEKMTINVKDFLHTVEFSDEAKEIQNKLYCD